MAHWGSLRADWSIVISTLLFGVFWNSLSLNSSLFICTKLSRAIFVAGSFCHWQNGLLVRPPIVVDSKGLTVK